MKDWAMSIYLEYFFFQQYSYCCNKNTKSSWPHDFMMGISTLQQAAFILKAGIWFWQHHCAMANFTFSWGYAVVGDKSDFAPPTTCAYSVCCPYKETFHMADIASTSTTMDIVVLCVFYFCFHASYCSSILYAFLLFRCDTKIQLPILRFLPCFMVAMIPSQVLLGRVLI